MCVPNLPTVATTTIIGLLLKQTDRVSLTSSIFHVSRPLLKCSLEISFEVDPLPKESENMSETLNPPRTTTEKTFENCCHQAVVTV